MAMIPLEGRQLKRPITNEDLFEQGLYAMNILQEFINKFEMSTIVYKKSFEEENVNSNKLYVTIQRLKPYVENIENIEDIHDLVFELGAIMKICSEIIELIDETDQSHKYLLRLSIIVHDLIKKVRAERFKKEEILLVKEALEKIIGINVSRDDVIQTDIKLMDKGLNWVIGE